jgi:hypothetical protein
MSPQGIVARISWQRIPVRAFSVGLCLCGAFLSSCGYHVAGRGNALPKDWKTIAVVAFQNRTPRYRLEQRFTQAVVRELIARTKYRIASDPENADAVLRGEVTGLESSAVLFDSATGRATTMLVSVKMKVELEERATKRMVWKNDAFLFREEYEISTDVPSFFEESEPALERMAREFAATLVSALLEKF